MHISVCVKSPKYLSQTMRNYCYWTLKVGGWISCGIGYYKGLNRNTRNVKKQRKLTSKGDYKSNEFGGKEDHCGLKSHGKACELGT